MDATQQSILRIDKSAGRWEAIPAALINDDRLGLDTRGFAGWLLARPRGWEIRATALPRLLTSGVSRVGREKAQRFLRELQRATYLTRTRRRGPNGCWIWDFCFRPTPVCGSASSATVDGLPVGGSAVDGQPVHYPQTLISSKHDQYQTRNTTTSPAAPKTGVPDGELIEIRFPEILNRPQLAAAGKKIVHCPPELRQAVLDELGAMMIQGVARYPLALLDSLIRKAGEGQFVPNRSRAAASSKADSTGRQRRTDRDTKPTAASPFRSAAAIAQQWLSGMHVKFDSESP